MDRRCNSGILHIESVPVLIWKWNMPKLIFMYFLRFNFAVSVLQIYACAIISYQQCEEEKRVGCVLYFVFAFKIAQKCKELLQMEFHFCAALIF